MPSRYFGEMIWRLNILNKSKEKQFQELYVNNDKLYKMAVRAINRCFTDR